MRQTLGHFSPFAPGFGIGIRDSRFRFAIADESRIPSPVIVQSAARRSESARPRIRNRFRCGRACRGGRCARACRAGASACLPPRECERRPAPAPRVRDPARPPSAAFLTSDSVSRTDRLRAMMSRATRRCSASSVRASNARAWPIDRRPVATSVRTSSGSFSRRRKFATDARSLPTARRDVLLLQLKLVGEPPVRERLFDRIQVLALDVLDERHLQQRSFLSRRDIANDDRHAQQAGELRGAPAAFAGDDLEPIADPRAPRSAG